MPVLKPITLTMNGVKSAELIQQLKAESEKNINQQKLLLKPNDSFGMVCIESGYQYEPKDNHLNSLRRNFIPYPDHNYGQQPPLTPPGLASPDPNEQTDTGNEDEDEEGVTRCICGFSHDDGYMICCDKCGSWQHIECMGIKSDSVPDTYLCDRCEPRRLDLDKARAIQMKKRDQLTDDDGDDDTDTDEELRSTSYTAISNTPTRITLTATPVIKKKSKNQLKSANSAEINSVRKRVNRKRQRVSTRQSHEELNLDSNSAGSQFCHDSFQLIDNNIYDDAVMSLKLENSEITMAANSTGDSKRIFCVSEIQDGKKGLVATEDIKAGQYITEYKGKILLLSTFEDCSPFFKRSHPYVLYYNGIEKTQLVIDARLAGNEARYIRRSCIPNSEIQHEVIDSKLHLKIICKEDIPKGYEIKMPFEYPLETYTGYIDCACRQLTCLAMKRNQVFLTQPGRKKMKYSVPDASTRNSASENQGETDSDDNELDVGGNDRSVSRRKKLSREERKLQAYVKQIEKMEKKEKKVKDPKAPLNRSGQYADLSQSYPQGSNPARLAQLNEGGISQNLIAPISRRVSTSTPVSAKKRLSVNKKRPRISSCSSDPLSPEIHNLTVSTLTPTTPAQESVVASVGADNNGNARQKARKDKEHSLLPLAYEKPLNGKESTRRLRKELIESRAGSPTPPSTPGQLSPLIKSCESQSLSVDITNSLSSPSGHHYLSHHDRRNVLDGLLQIAHQTDTQSPSSGSPVNSNVTSNGMVTSEEVMGDIVERDGDLDTPTGRTVNGVHGKISQERGYYGSLKKRWLVQYDGRLPFQARQLNGVAPLSLSTLVNDYSIRKRAAQIAAYTFKAPINSIPLKKRRLRDAFSSVKKPESNMVDKIQKDGGTPNEDNDGNIKSGGGVELVEENVKDDSNRDLKNVAGFIDDNGVNIDKSHAIETTKDDNNERTSKETDDYCNRIIDKNGSNNEPKIVTEIEAESRDNSMKSYEHESKAVSDSGTVTTPASQITTSNEVSLKSSELESCDASKQGASVINAEKTDDVKGVECEGIKTDIPCIENEEGKLTEITSHEGKIDLSEGQISETTAEIDSMKNPIKPSVVSKYEKIASDEAKEVLSEATIESSVKQEAPRVDMTKGEIVKARASSMDATTTNATILGNDHSINESIERISAMIRDPRLSSSSSRSSRDSVDNILSRSDSVSSLEEATAPKLDAEKRILSGSIERLDGTPTAKKKMSLREYRNRKRTKPPTSTAQVNAHQVSDVSPVKVQNDASAALLTNTEALLTPRTLSLSSSFANQHARDTVLSSTSHAVRLTDNAMPHAPVILHETPRMFNTSSGGSTVPMMLHPSATGMPLTTSGALLSTSAIPTATTPMVPETSSIMHLPSSLMHLPVSAIATTDVLQQDNVSTSNGPMFEPVSPDDDYKTDNGPTSQSLQNASASVFDVKPTYTTVASGKMHLHAQILGSEKKNASPCDAMDIEDDEDSSSANKILVGMPNMETRKQFMQNISKSFGRQATNSSYHMQVVRGLQQQQQQQGNKISGNRSPSNRHSQGYNQQFR